MVSGTISTDFVEKLVQSALLLSLFIISLELQDDKKQITSVNK